MNMEDKQYQFLKYYFDKINLPVPEDWKQLYNFPVDVQDPTDWMLFIVDSLIEDDYHEYIFDEDKIAYILSCFDQDTCNWSMCAVHRNDYKSIRLYGTEGGPCVTLDKNYGISNMLINIDTTKLSHKELIDTVERIKSYQPKKIYYGFFAKRYCVIH